MLPGDYDQPADVRDLSTYAIVNGIRREIDSVSVDRELTGDLPDQVVAAGGVAGSSGTIVWAATEDTVAVQSISPWHKPGGWPPTSGQRVQIYVTDGATSFPRFTGVIDRTTGQIGGSYQSTIIDDRDRMNTHFTHEALLRSHVPLREGGWYRRIGMDHWHMLTRALRRAQLYNTPRQLPTSAMSAVLQGSAWPEAGTLSEASGTGSNVHPVFSWAPWGWAASSAELEYLPAISDMLTQTLQISFMVSEDHAGDGHIRVYYGTNPDHRIRVRVWGSRAVSVYWNNTEAARLSPEQMDGATIVTVLIKGNTWTIRNNARREVSGTVTRSGTARMERIEILLDEQARMAGIQVNRPTVANEFEPTRFTPSLICDPGVMLTTMDMTPRMQSRNVADLVDEICKATLTSAWWDETGVFRLMSAERLRQRWPVQTITTLDDITALSWEDSLLHVRSQVTVTWKDPVISRGRRTRVELFRGSGNTMGAEDENDVFATADDRTEWFGVDWDPLLLNDSNWGTYNRGDRSFMGVHYTDNDGNEMPTSSQSTTIQAERLGHSGLKIRHLAGTYGSGVEAHLETSKSAQALREHRRGENLPVIRGRGMGVWADEEDTSPITGPSYAPALTHDLGYWGHRRYGQHEGTTSALSLANYIAEMVTVPHPTVTGVDVTYDPRRQLGDMININLRVLDVQLQALIVGISESHEAGTHHQTLKLRIVSATSSRRVTYQQLADAWDGRDYNALKAVWANLTYDDFTEDPLEGA